MASINLAKAYSGKIAEKFTKSSYTAANACRDYDFAGVRSISIYTPQTVELNDYVRTGQNRFGTPVEMTDAVQELELTQDKSFALTIDKGNDRDQMNVKGAARMLKIQIKEQVVPYMDKYALSEWAHKAGTIVGTDKPTKSTIVPAIFEASAVMDNLLVPDENRVLYLPTSSYNLLRQSQEFLAVDNLAEKALSKGYVGMVADMKVIKVPDVYMPGVYFLAVYTGSVLLPNKIKTARILSEVAGIDGNVLEGRNYFDAFVLSAKAGGVYTAADKSLVAAAPEIAVAKGTATVTAEDKATVFYTTDGSDPRYSKEAKAYTAPFDCGEGPVRAYAVFEGGFASPVAGAQ